MRSATSHFQAALADAIDDLHAHLPAATVTVEPTGQASTDTYYAAHVTVTAADGTTYRTTNAIGDWESTGDDLDSAGELADALDAVLRAADHAVAERLNAAATAAAADITAALAGAPAAGRDDLLAHLRADHGLADRTLLGADDDRLAEMHRFEHDEAGAAHAHDTDRGPALAGNRRAIAVDAVKRAFDVPKRVAASVVDDARHDLVADAHTGAAAHAAELVASVAAGRMTARAVGLLVGPTSDGRLGYDVVTGDADHPALHVTDADNYSLLAVRQDDWSTATAPTNRTIATGLPADGGPNPATAARRLARLAATVERGDVACISCGTALDAHNTTEGGTSGGRPWCDRCMRSTDVWQCELCSNAVHDDFVHTNSSAVWCPDCHDASDPDTHCERHDDECVDA